MKNYILLILFVFSASVSQADALDRIKTKQDLLKFIAKHLRGEINEHLFSEQAKAQGWNMKYTHIGTDTFYITDLDKNGRNDLIIDGTEFYILLGKGNNRFEVHSSNAVTTNYTYLGIRKTDSSNHLLVRVSIANGDGSFRTYDTAVVYKNQSFIEHIPFPTNHLIDQIEYSYSPGFCFDCEDYKMVITRAHSEYNRISQTLNNMRFSELEEQYSQGATDLPTGELTIYYDSGKTKTISDYGLAGTLALQQLYLQFDGIQNKLNKK